MVGFALGADAITVPSVRGPPEGLAEEGERRSFSPQAATSAKTATVNAATLAGPRWKRTPAL